MSVRLTAPAKEYLDGYFEARDEFRERGLPCFDNAVPDGTPPEEVLKIYENRRRGVGLPDGYVPDSTFWLIHDHDEGGIGEFIGLGNIRHELNDTLKIMGGHIGYAIRPTLWNRGYATLLLGFLLKEAAGLGLREVLLTCDIRNAASAKVMEKNGGRLVETVEHLFQGRPRRTCHYIFSTGNNEDDEKAC